MPGGDVVLRVVAEKGASVGQVLSDVESGFSRAASNVRASTQQFNVFGERAQGAADKAAVAFGAVGTSAALMAKRFVDSASEMEQFRARLETVQHSAVTARATIDEMVRQAASSPFEIKGLVEASVKLEALGQNSRALMPMVVQAAAGMGKPVQDTAEAIGKAFGGSAEGFEILRNQFGMTTFALKKYGADVDATGQLLVKTPSQLARATAAVKMFLGTTFGGATERQMDTFAGAMSNVSDSGGRLTAAFGSRLLPAFTSVAKAASATVEIFERLPAPIKDLVAFGTVFVGVGGLMGAALLGLGTRALGLVGTLNDMAKSYLAVKSAAEAAAAAEATRAATSGVGGGAGAAATATATARTSALAEVLGQLGTRTVAWASSPVGLFVAAGTVAMAGLAAATSSMEERNRVWREGVESDAQRVNSLSGAVRVFTSVLQDLENKKRGIKPGEGVATSLPKDLTKWIAGSLSSATPAELASALQKHGISNLKDLEKMLQEPVANAKEAREREGTLRGIISAREKYGRVQKYGASEAQHPELPTPALPDDMPVSLSEMTLQGGLSPEAVQKIRASLGGRDTVTMGELRIEADSAEKVNRNLTANVERFATEAPKKLGAWTDAEDVIRSQKKNFQEYFTFLDKEGSSAAQRSKAATLGENAQQIQAALKKVGLKTDSDSIREYLKSDSFSPDKKEVIGRLLEIRGERKKAFEEARKLDAEEVQKKIEGLKQELASKKALGQATVEDERRTQAAIAALRGQHSWNKLVGAKEVEDRKATFEEQISASKSYLERLKSQNLLTHSQEAAGYQRILASVRDFRKNVLPDLIKKDPTAAQSLTTWMTGLERDATVKQGEATKAARLQQITDVKRINEKFLEDQRARHQLSTERELEIVRQGRERLEKVGRGNGEPGTTPEQANANFMRRQAELQAQASAIENDPKLTQDQKAKKLAELAEKKTQIAEYYTTLRGYMLDEASLQKRLHEEELSRQQERNNTRLSFLSLQLEELKEQQASGKRVNDQVLANLDRQLALRLANIQLVAQKELEVQGLTQDQITAIHEKANVQRLEALRAQRAALKQILEDQSGGLKDIQQKVSGIKQQAEEAKKTSPSTWDTWGQDAFGAAERAGQSKRDAQTIDQYLRKPGLDHGEMQSLRTALERQGLLLTGDETLGRQHVRTPGGATYVTMEQLRREYGVGTKDSTQQIADEISRLDKQIDELEKTIGAGLQTEVSNLGGTITTLAQAVDKLSNKVSGTQTVATGATSTRAQTAEHIPEVQAAWKKFSDTMADINRRESADKAARGKDITAAEKERYGKERESAESEYDKVLDRYGIKDASRPLTQAAEKHQKAAADLSQAASDLSAASGVKPDSTRATTSSSAGGSGGSGSGGGASASAGPYKTGASASTASSGTATTAATASVAAQASSYSSPSVEEQIRLRASRSSPWYDPRDNTNRFPSRGGRAWGQGGFWLSEADQERITAARKAVSKGVSAESVSIPSGFQAERPDIPAREGTAGNGTVIHATNYITMDGGLAPAPVQDAMKGLNSALGKAMLSPNRDGMLGVM